LFIVTFEYTCELTLPYHITVAERVYSLAFHLLGLFLTVLVQCLRESLRIQLLNGRIFKLRRYLLGLFGTIMLLRRLEAVILTGIILVLGAGAVRATSLPFLVVTLVPLFPLFLLYGFFLFYLT
jgi:hypothetical protein